MPTLRTRTRSEVKINRTRVRIQTALLAGFLILCGLSFAAPADSVVAVVGATPILESDVEQAMDFVRIAMGDTITPDSTLRRQVLKQLIDTELLQEQARRDTIDVSRDEVTSEVESSIRSLKQRFAGEEEFQAALVAEGVNERTLRRRYEEDIRRKLLARKLLEKEGLTKSYISPAEAELFYNTHKDSIARVPGRVELAHILVAIGPSPQAESAAGRRAAEVLDVLARGGDFAVVASSFSEDRKTAGAGGYWGWRQLAELPAELVMVLEQLKPGQISPPFVTREGYVIVKLEARSGKRVSFRSILIRVPITRADTTRALARARAAYEKASSGLPFDSLARALSDDPMTRDSGGYLGEFLLAGLTPPFDSVVARLDSGGVSEPVLSEHGYHLVKVLAKQPERMMTYLEMQDMIRNYLEQQHLAERLEQYLARVAQKTYVRQFN
ncbi:MAG: peptidylprolyl isomerase [candidate division WOR-3 bacterium]